MTDPRARLLALVEGSGLSRNSCARAIGVDPRTMRRWLNGDDALPGNRVSWLLRVRSLTAGADGWTATIRVRV